MRIIKPGKLNIHGAKIQAPVSLEDYKVERQVWDDFSVDNKKKKKEFEKGSGNRMIPKPHRQRFEKDDKFLLGLAEDEANTANHEVDYSPVEERLGYHFNDTSLLAMAFTHRSALGIRERADYERLEFLGDAVLDLAVAHLLSDFHPEAREGELSKMRAALVNTQALATFARNLELGTYIRLGRGESSSGGADRPSILADVMEATIGAIYRDGGFETAMAIIQGIFKDSLREVTPSDPKTELQEVLHACGSEPPEYLLELMEGPEHAPTFVTVVIIDGEVVGRGRGPTKKAAQQVSAAEALKSMTPSATPILLKEGQVEIISEALMCSPHAILSQPAA